MSCQKLCRHWIPVSGMPRRSTSLETSARQADSAVTGEGAGHATGHGDVHPCMCVVRCWCMCFPTHDLGCRGLSFARSLQPPAHLLSVRRNWTSRFRSTLCRSTSMRLPFGRSVHTALPPKPNEPGLRPSTPRPHGERLRSFETQKSFPPFLGVCCVLYVFNAHFENTLDIRLFCFPQTRLCFDRRILCGVSHQAVSISLPHPYHGTHGRQTDGSLWDRRTGFEAPQAQSVSWFGLGTEDSLKPCSGRIAAPSLASDMNPWSGTRLPHEELPCQLLREEARRFFKCRLHRRTWRLRELYRSLQAILSHESALSPAHEFLLDAVVLVTRPRIEEGRCLVTKPVSTFRQEGGFLFPFPLFKMANAKTPPSAQPTGAHDSTTENRRPTFREKYGDVVISTWPKTVKAGSPDERNTWVTTASREYRKLQDGETVHTAQLFPKDLLCAGVGLVVRYLELELHSGIRTKETCDAE